MKSRRSLLTRPIRTQEPVFPRPEVTEVAARGSTPGKFAGRVAAITWSSSLRQADQRCVGERGDIRSARGKKRRENLEQADHKRGNDGYPCYVPQRDVHGRALLLGIHETRRHLVRQGVVNSCPLMYGLIHQRSTTN